MMSLPIQSIVVLTVEVNLEPSAVGSAFREHIYGLASEQVPDFVDDLLRTVLQKQIMDV